MQKEIKAELKDLRDETEFIINSDTIYLIK